MYIAKMQQAKRITFVKDGSCHFSATSTHRGDLMMAGEQEAYDSFQNPSNAHGFRNAICVDRPLDAVQLCQVSSILLP